jgi:hypothetical protein
MGAAVTPTRPGYTVISPLGLRPVCRCDRRVLAGFCQKRSGQVEFLASRLPGIHRETIRTTLYRTIERLTGSAVARPPRPDRAALGAA